MRDVTTLISKLNSEKEIINYCQYSKLIVKIQKIVTLEQEVVNAISRILAENYTDGQLNKKKHLKDFAYNMMTRYAASFYQLQALGINGAQEIVPKIFDICEFAIDTVVLRKYCQQCSGCHRR